MTSPKNSTPETRNINRWIGVAATALIISASGCVVSSEEDPQEPESGAGEPTPQVDSETEDQITKILASSTTTSTPIGGDLKLDIHALERVGEDFLRLHFSVTNNSTDSFTLGYNLASKETEDSGGGITLIDSINQQRYLSYKQSDGRCFCNTLDGTLASGSTEDLWVVFPAPPDDLESMTVATPATPPMLDIPISTSSESIENNNLEEREVLDLTLISDNLEDQTGRTESGEEISILLSSDVLFEINSSNLNNEAQGILEQVAQEIDDASSSTVSIDGYADNTGEDSINVPLSEERAKSVESALSELVNREGVSFEVEGHGSADPIADNNTEEGRERNRRVSVTFEK